VRPWNRRPIQAALPSSPRHVRILELYFIRLRRACAFLNLEGLMHKLHVAVGFASAFALSACCHPPAAESQSVSLDAQQTDMWCWAASGQMTMNFVHPPANVQQCDEANKQFSQTDCCSSPTPAICVNGGWPEYGKYQFAYDKTTDAPLSLTEIEKEISCEKRPFAFSWHWNGGGGHMMVAIGYQSVNGSDLITVNNPWPPSSPTSSGGVVEIQTYEKYVGGQGQDHTHWDDYYHIAYSGH
jgi:hypothetical protein